MLNSTHSAAELDHRSRLATRLKYGPATRSAAGDRATNIPFPDGLAPTPSPLVPAPGPSDPLPTVDVVAMMDTAPESRAMADVLTPGVDVTAWYPYARNFTTTYLPHVGPRGPSRESHRLGSYFVTVINGLRVLVYKTELHMHEDAMRLADGMMSLPIKTMLRQIIAEAKPTLFLTTGTSGGVYPSMRLGDVVVTRAARFQCLRDFEHAPYNGKRFESRWTVPTTRLAAAETLMAGFAEHLTGLAEPKGTPPDPGCGCPPARAQDSAGHGDRPAAPRIYRDGARTIPAFHPILTTDIFEFGTTVNRLDTLGLAVEMDDACLGLACSELASPPKWACVRNLSDPVINGSLPAAMQERCADYYYEKFGYWTTVMSALATWGIVAGLTEAHPVAERSAVGGAHESR